MLMAASCGFTYERTGVTHRNVQADGVPADPCASWQVSALEESEGVVKKLFYLCGRE